MTLPPRLPSYIPPQPSAPQPSAPYIPPRQTLSRPSASAINKSSATPQELSLALPGFDEVLPIVYGEDRIAGLWLVRPYVASSQLRFAIAWCWGEIEGVQAVYINGAAVPGGVTMTHYAGTGTQTPSSLLATDLAGFNDAYANIAYTVFQVPTGAITGFPNTAQIEAVVRGRIVRDPRIPDADPVTARYWRILISETRTTLPNFFASIAEIEMRATSGGVDQTGSGTAYASSETVNTASQAFDNSPSTRWASGENESAPQWIAYDFGSAVSVAQITIQSGNSEAVAARAPRSFEVQYSDDGAAWDTAASFTNESEWAVSEVRAFSVVPGLLWSRNPALCMADFIQSDVFGPAMSATGVVATADRCDEIVAGSEVRCEMGLTIKNPMPLDQMLDLFSAYAECLWSYDGDGILMVPDAPVTAPDATLTEADIIAGTLRLTAEDSSSAPTVVSMTYRVPGATAAAQWEEKVHIQMLPEVSAGDVPAVRSDLQMLGLRRQTEAARKAIMRLRRLNYPGRYAWQAFDDGIKFQRGDVVQLPNMRGMTDRMVRILSTEMPSPGIYQVTAEQYDANMYSDDFVPGDTANVPVGGILMYSGSSIPDGYTRFADADDKYIVGAGGALSPGATGGSDSVSVGSANTSSGGIHSGERLLPLAGAPGGAGVDMPSSPFTPPFSGSHFHAFSMSAATVRPLARKSVWIKKTTAPGLIPEQAGVLSDGEIISSALTLAAAHIGRLLMSDTANANHGSTTAAGTGVVTAASNSHTHGAINRERIFSGPDIVGTMFDPPYYAAGGGSHGHGASTPLTITPSVRRRRLSFYQAGSDAQIQPGCIIGFDPSETLPAGWEVCDGTNGTVDLRDYFVELSGLGSAGTAAGNNTAIVSGTTAPDAGHSHDAPGLGLVTPYSQWWHPSGETHNHPISHSVSFVPPFYAMLFVQYTGAP